MTWFLYEYSETDDHLGTCETFFVMLGDEIIDEGFKIFSHVPDRNPTEKLVQAGIWVDALPSADKSRERELWSNETAWRIGWMRAAYKRFYENTNAGRAYAMAPGTKLFDSMNYWLVVEDPAEVPSAELAKQIQTVSDRVISMWRFIKLVAFVGAALAVVRWFWK